MSLARSLLARAARSSHVRGLSSLASAGAAAHSTAGRMPWQRVLTGAVALTALATGARAASNAAQSESTSSSASSIAASAPPASGKVRVGLVQLSVGADKAANLSLASERVGAAVAQGAKLVVLPEMFNCPYTNASFGPYSESLPEVGATAAQVAAMRDSPSAQAMSALARKHGIWLVAGSMPERAAAASPAERHPKSGLDFLLYNTALIFGPEGQVVGKHRKVHLFDIDVPGKMTFRESDTLTAGQTPTLFDTPFGRVGVGICYDMRFGEYAALLAARGASMLIYPGAFNTTTGPMHWELLQRARAVDNQLWVLTCSPARSADPKAYQAWGHSSAISPWGRVVATTEHQPDVVVTEVDMSEVDEMRKNIPVRTQKRTDIYRTQE